MPFRVEIAPAAARDLRQLSPQARERLEPAILALAQEPRPQGVRKIRGTDQTYRIRIGPYRVIFGVLDGDQLVVVLRAGRRAESTYRNL